MFAIPRFPGGTAPPAAATPTPVREEPRTAKPWSDESEDDDEPRYESMPADEDESEDDEDADELEAAGDHDDEDEDDDADDDDEAGDEEAGDELELDSLSDHVRESRSSGEMKRPPMPSRPVPERPASGQKQRPNDWVSMVTSIGAGSPKRDPSIISHNLAPDPIAREPRVEPDEPVRPCPRAALSEDGKTTPQGVRDRGRDSPAPIAYEDAAEASIEPAAEEAPAALETHASARASDDFAMGPIVPDQPWSPESETPVGRLRARAGRRSGRRGAHAHGSPPAVADLPRAEVAELRLHAVPAVSAVGGHRAWAVRDRMVGGNASELEAPGGPPRAVVGLAARSVGLGGPIFTVRVTSDPAGAFIALDGKPTGIRSPADVELKPGPHRIQISIPEFGSTEFTVEGARGEHVALDAPLAGALSIRVPDLSPPVAVSVDGTPLGYAPLQIPDLSPGAHDVEFSSAGQPSWSQTVRIPVRGTAEVLARPFDLPGTGVLEVRANCSGEEGTQELKGAVVIVDGDKRGTTPLSLELQRGPHSVRAIYRGEESIVQVIDLPGGNQRFATFSFGAGVEVPRVRLDLPPGAIPRDRPTTVSAALQASMPPTCGRCGCT